MVQTKRGKEVKIIFGTGVSSEKTYEALLPMVRISIQEGIVGFDTAPSYGTEETLGKCISRCMEELHVTRQELYIQTKLDALQMVGGRGGVLRHVCETMQKMKMDYFDAILVHWPVPEYLPETWDCLVELQRKGLVRYIGVCNVRIRQLREITEFSTPPQIIQIERHPLRICKDEVVFCLQKSINVQAYSPLCKMNKEIADSDKMARIAGQHHKNIGQVAIRWHMDTGVVPVFTSKKESRIREYASLENFSLTESEIEMVDSLNKDYKMYLESLACPGF